MGANTVEEMRREAFLKLSTETKREIFNVIADKLDISATSIEKDWWVTVVLNAIFTSSIAENIQFKGGTSLSKCWKLINRFSEDIDLAIKSEALGFNGPISKNQISNKLRRKAKEYTLKTIKPTIEDKLKKLKVEGLQITDNCSDQPTQDPIQIQIDYPSVYEEESYIKPRIMLEITGRANNIKVKTAEIKSLIDEVVPENNFSCNGFKVNAIEPERTFIEKVCLLHEEFNKSHGQVRHIRMSRHIYDLYMMCQKEIDQKALSDEELFTNIIKHRFLYNRIDGVDYNTERPGSFTIIPPGENLKLWKGDYENTMSKMLYGNNRPTFQQIITRMEQLQEDLNSMQWKNIPEFHPGEKTEKQVSFQQKR